LTQTNKTLFKNTRTLQQACRKNYNEQTKPNNVAYEDVLLQISSFSMVGLAYAGIELTFDYTK